MSAEGRELTMATRAWLKVGVRSLEPVSPAVLDRPLAESRLAVLSTGGATTPGQEPFSTGKTGDPSFRAVPSDVDPSRLSWAHPHYDTGVAVADPDVVFPLRLLRRLVEEGEVGSLAPTAISMMGYAPLTKPLREETAPAVGELMQGEEVDAALLCPA